MIATQEWVKSLLKKVIKPKYSTEETIVGTWVDGKTIYRRVYTAKNVSLTGNTIIDPNFKAVNIDTLIKLDVNTLEANTTWNRADREFKDGSTLYTDRVVIYGQGLRLSISNITINAYSIIVEYTKP